MSCLSVRSNIIDVDLESGLYTQLSLFFTYIIPNYLPWLITSFGFQQQLYLGILNLEHERALGSQSPISIFFHCELSWYAL